MAALRTVLFGIPALVVWTAWAVVVGIGMVLEALGTWLLSKVPAAD